MKFCAVSGTEIVHFTFKAYIYKTLYEMLLIARLKFLLLLCVEFLCSLCVAPMKALKACRNMDSFFKFTAGHELLGHCLEMELYVTVLKGSAGSGLQVLNSDQS